MARPESQPLYADDTDNESDPGTPRPARHGVRKRLSEVHNPENDSFNSDTGVRQPLRAVNINDDAAEKRRRRKSTKFVLPENAVAGPSSEVINDGEAADTSRTARQKQQLNAVTAPVIDVPPDVMSSNFEEWMKMATDNKINAANSWNFALIDYFHDMSLLRNDGDNSINFQRASCTLDGCVKIWTSRVDSVGTETAKLASNLASGGRDADGDDDDDENADDDPSQPKKKKAHRAASTLVKDVAQLQSKKLDLEFSVDPLFRKTCADFDEGGAQGLLMNHLSLGVGKNGGLTVVFDASDSVGKMDEEDDTEEPQDDVDLSFLRQHFMPDLAVLEDKAISQSLEEFSFSKDGFSFDDATFYQENTHRADLDDDDDHVDGDNFHMDVDPAAAPVDFFADDNAGGDDYGGDMMGGDDYGGDGHSNGSVGPGGEHSGPGNHFVPFDPRRNTNERDLVMTEGDGDSTMMDYFDNNFSGNWAGPEHWRMRKVIRRPETDPNAPKVPKVRKEKKEAFKIDFTTASDKDPKELLNELFAPVGKGASINLPGTSAASKKSKKKTKEKEKKDDHRLPDDMHFSSRQLVTLFLKPKFSLKMRGHRVKFNENGDGEVDENFWAQAAAGQASGPNGDEDGDDSGGAIPFNTQFFHDDYDDAPGFDDGDAYDGPGAPDIDAGEQDLLAATQGQTRRVKPEFVNYAKRAKRVDVRKLKENIWKGLDIVVAKDEPDAMDVSDDIATPTDPSEARQFDSVLSNLQKSYPREKMEEISTSFCFICLLHLANEQGLKIRNEDTEDDVEEESESIGENRIGNIWDLKIYRDPDASQSA